MQQRGAGGAAAAHRLDRSGRVNFKVVDCYVVIVVSVKEGVKASRSGDGTWWTEAAIVLR